MSFIEYFVIGELIVIALILVGVVLYRKHANATHRKSRAEVHALRNKLAVAEGQRHLLTIENEKLKSASSPM